MNFNVFYSWGQRFLHLRSEAKVKAGIFVGPQIKKIIECDEFANLLNRMENTAWNRFVAVVLGFLGNHKAENYVQLVQTLIKNYATMECRMSLKSKSSTLIFINSRTTWELTQRSKASAFIKIYWTLNVVTKNSRPIRIGVDLSKILGARGPDNRR